MPNKNKSGLDRYTDHELLHTPVAQELIKRDYKIIHRSILNVIIKSKRKDKQSKYKYKESQYDEFE